MNYYINIAKALETLTAEEMEEGEVEISRALRSYPSEEISAYATHPDMETKMRVFMTKMFPEMLRDSLNSNATLTVSVLYDAGGGEACLLQYEVAGTGCWRRQPWSGGLRDSARNNHGHLIG